MKHIPLGIQLYTVRNELKNDFRGTMQALAQMGYQGVEFAWNYGGLSPEELAAFLEELGLKACGLHSRPEKATDPASEDYAYAKAIKSSYITVSLAQEVAKDWNAAIEVAQNAAEVAQSRGFIFTYHNHAQEFQTLNGECALDVLFRSTDPEKVYAELDTGWIIKGGEDPVAYLGNYTGRVPQIHLKDVTDNGTITEIGNGLLDLPAIYDVADKIGAQWIIYEQDACNVSELQSARISIENIKSAGLI